MAKKVLISVIVFCIICSLILRFCLTGYTFGAGCFLAAAVICAIYLLLCIYRSRFPKFTRSFSIALTSALCLTIAAAAVTEIFIIRAARDDENTEADYVIVLGAALHGDTPSLTLTERLERAVDYLNQYPNAKAIVTGGMGEGESMSEGEGMYVYLTNRGINRDRIIIEDKASNTVENIRYSKDIIEKLSETVQNNEPIAVISSEYHILRAKLLMKREGLNPVGVAAGTQIIPLRINYFIREIPAVIKTVLFP